MAADDWRTGGAERALFVEGMAALKAGDLETAIGKLGEHLAEAEGLPEGQLGPNTAMAYFKYGSALLYKVQEEADVLGEPLAKASAAASAAAASAAPEEKAEGAAADKGKGKAPAREQDDEQDQEGEEGGGGEEEEEDDDDGSDLTLAYKMLELARITYERHPDAPGGGKQTMSEIRARLGECLMESEAFAEAAEEFRAAADLRTAMPPDRNLVFALFQRCVCESELKRFADAHRSCEAAAAAAAAAAEKATPEEAQALKDIIDDIDAKREEIEEAATREPPPANGMANEAAREALAAGSAGPSALKKADAAAFGAPTLAAAPVQDLGVVKKSKGQRIALAPVAQPAPKKARLADGEEE